MSQVLEIFEDKCITSYYLGELMLFSISFSVIQSFLLGSFICILADTLFLSSLTYIIYQNYISIIRLLYLFIYDLASSQTVYKSVDFTSILFSIFFIILAANLLGLVPFSWCINGQLSVTFLLSFTVFLGLTIYSFLIQNLNFLNLFIPKNVPAIILPFLVVIELISYFSRALSLAIRLFANMVAGHALLHILTAALIGSFRLSFNILLHIIMFFPALIVASIIVLEMGIAFLQSYVFLVLICIYMVDIFEVSH